MRTTPSARSPAPTRAALIGKVLLWVFGIPLLIIVFALAALTRGMFGSARAPDRREPGHAQPPAIYQPKGPEQPRPIPQRADGGIER